MASSPPEQWRQGWLVKPPFCGHVNFPEMNGRISVYGGGGGGGGESNNHKEGGIVIPNNTLQK